MSKLSKYANHARRPSVLPARRVAGVLLLAATGLSFCLAQLSLQFSVSDLHRETRNLQTQRLELQSRINRIKSDVARLEKGDRLVERAQQLGMVEFVVADVERFTVDPEIQNRYAVARAGSEKQRQEDAAPGAEFGRAIAMRLGLEQPAQAQDR